MRKYKNFRSFHSRVSTLLKISLTQFRNYGAASFSFPDKITCITGANGSGKTALLDAVYYLCYTKSYFTAQQQQVVQTGTDGFRIEGRFQNPDQAETITCKWRNGKKEVLANGAEYEKVTDHISKYAAVMIAPDDMELINDGSELRRKWLDSILGQTDKQYLYHLLQYVRVLQQRNSWLKMEAAQPSPDGHILDYYNQQLAQSGTYIYEQRNLFIQRFLPLLDDYYRRLSSGKEKVAMQYSSDLHEQPLMNWLPQSLQNDLRLQRTTRGIHKDELRFLINDMPLKQYGSQGQKKSFLFALKLAQYAYLRQELRQSPILLLDDIFEKLDQQRMQALLRAIQEPIFGQVLLTDTHAERVIAAFGDAVKIGVIGL